MSIQDLEKKYKDMTDEKFREIHKDNPVLSKMEELKESDLMRVLNASYIAERFFGKTRSWFSQKLNHNIKNGIPASFTPEEQKILRNALYTLAMEIEEFADSMQ